MTMMVMQASGIGIRTILTSMIIKPFLYVVAGGKNVRGLVLISHVFFISYKKSASTFHVERRHILRKKAKVSARTTNPQIHSSWGGGRVLISLDRHVYRLVDRR